MRVVLATGSLNVGGAERQLVNLARTLSSRGIDIHVLCHRGHGDLDGELTSAGIPLHLITDQIPLTVQGQVTRAVRRLRPDVIYAFMSAAGIRMTLAKPASPRTALIWGIRDAMEARTSVSTKGRVARSVARQLCRQADLIVINSFAGIRHYTEHGYPPSKMEVVPNGIDTDRFTPDNERGRHFRLQHGIAPDAPLVGMLARFDPIKGHDDFLRAGRHIIEQVQNARLVVVGRCSQPRRSEYLQLAAALGVKGRLVLVDQVDQPEAALNAFDVTVIPSHSEGFSNSLAEAMSCSSQVVVTDAGDNAIIVGDDSLVVPVANPDLLGERVTQVLKPLDYGFSRANYHRSRIIERYGLEVCADTTLELLQRVAPSSLT